MKDVNGNITYKGKNYRLVFNLNVMEAIQDEYGTLERWGDLTDGTKVVRDDRGDPVLNDDGEIMRVETEPNAKAVKFGFWAMLNEGIEIDNEENGTNEPPLTLRQVGRMLTEIGMDKATSVLNETVVESTESERKNE